MWFHLINFPFFFNYLYIVFNILFKQNTKSLNLYNLNIFFNSIVISVVLVNLRKSYNYLFLCILDILINFLHQYPSIFKFYYKYRRHKYVEICIIKYTICFKSAKYIFFKILNEFLVFIYPFLKNTVNKVQLNPFINYLISIKLFKYYAHFVEYIDSSIIVNFSFNTRLIGFYNSSKLNNFILKYKIFLLNWLKNVS